MAVPPPNIKDDSDLFEEKSKPRSKSPQVEPLGTASEEAVKLARNITALRNALRLVHIQAGRVMASCTTAVGPFVPEPEQPVNPGESRGDTAEDWVEDMSADHFAFYVGTFARSIGLFDGELIAVLNNTIPAIEKAHKGELK